MDTINLFYNIGEHGKSRVWIFSTKLNKQNLDDGKGSYLHKKGLYVPNQSLSFWTFNQNDPTLT